MKVQKTTTQSAFQPVVLTITIENESEKELLYDLMWHNVGIPDFLVEKGEIPEESRASLTHLMSQILEQLS